jgi:arylsulfatase A-like enzyme
VRYVPLFTRLAAVLLFAVAAATPCAARQPNVVILLADDLGYADVGFHGCRDIPTPHIDALAASGVRCTSGYVSGVYCSPTRAGLITGRYQQRFGHEYNPGARGETGGDLVESIGLPLSEKTIADRFRDAGYATGMVGKSHLGMAKKFRPNHRGFDEFFGFLGAAMAYRPGMDPTIFPGLESKPIPMSNQPVYRGDSPVDEPEYLTDAFAREAVSFIDRHRERPFLLYLAFNAVHTPMNATDERLARFASIADPERRTYAAMTLALDDAVGRVVEAVRKSGLEQDTVFFFLSDNGGPTVRKVCRNGAVNTPLRGSKLSTLEGGIRVPFVVSWPGRLPAGRVHDGPVIQLDIMTTALAAAGVDIRPELKLDGVNLLPQLAGDAGAASEEAADRALYWRMGTQMAIRHGNWKLVRYAVSFSGETPGDEAPNQSAGTSPPRLYDLGQDIGEASDLAGSHPDKVAELQQRWDRWNETLVEPLWMPKAEWASPPGHAREAAGRVSPAARP